MGVGVDKEADSTPPRGGTPPRPGRGQRGPGSPGVTLGLKGQAGDRSGEGKQGPRGVGDRPTPLMGHDQGPHTLCPLDTGVTWV